MSSTEFLMRIPEDLPYRLVGVDYAAIQANDLNPVRSLFYGEGQEL
jgi:hypothetical protein